MPERNWQIARGDLVLGTLPESEVLALLQAGFLMDEDVGRLDATAEWQPLGALRNADLEKQTSVAISSAQPAVVPGSFSRRDIPRRLAGSAVALTAKVASGVFAQRRKVSETAVRLLNNFTPQISGILRGLTDTAPFRAARSRMHDDEFMRKLFGAAYDCLPRPVQRFVNEESFVMFCLNNRQRLLGMTES